MSEHIFMDSKVEVIGYMVKTLTRGFRSVKCVSGDPLHNIETEFEIPVVYWTRSTRGNRLFQIKEGEKVRIIGRLDYDKDYHLMVVCENYEIIKE
jgi:hypothetical protein